MRFESVKNAPAKLTSRGNAHQWLHWSGTLPEFFAWAESLPKFAHYVARKDLGDKSKWAGFLTETPSAAERARYSRDAHEALKSARAILNTPVKAPGRSIPSPVGGSFNIGRVLQGHPLSAYRRQRAALPPKTIEVALSATWDIDQKTIAASISRIARAAWEYHLAGGVVNIRIHYILGFDRPDANGNEGLIITINLPTENIGQLATAASVQFFRGFAIPAAQALSPVHNDPLHAGSSTLPGIHTLRGKPADDAPILKALQID